MSVISFNQADCAVKKGTTWGTEVAVSSGTRLLLSKLSISGGWDDFLPRDCGLSPKRVAQTRIAFNANVSIDCDLTFGQGWLTLLAAFLGSESTPSEQTTGQLDYKDDMDLADDTFGQFMSLAYMPESDRVFSIPSLKVVGVKISQDIPGAGTVSFQCIGDVWDETLVSSVANIQSNPFYSPYEEATFGGANHYFRINADGGAALSSSDNKIITGYEINLTRSHNVRRGSRGLLSALTMEPKQTAIDGTLMVKLSELDNASFDAFGDWKNRTTKKAELFIDGSQIGSGLNKSIKIQLPYLQATGAIPPGHDIQNNTGMFLPAITYRMLKRYVGGVATAPSGMTGVTEPIRVSVIYPTRTTKWLI